MDFKAILSKLRNSGTVISIVSLVILLLATNGVEIDNERVMTTVKTICALLVILGAMNNPESAGFTPLTKTEVKEPVEESNTVK